MFIIVSYDIVDDRHRNRLHETLKNFGKAVQYSVFECNLTEIQFTSMKEKTDKFVENEKDSIRYYLFPRQENLKLFITGKDKGFYENNFYII